MWANGFWHHAVHRRLGETLHYYFLRLQPFEPTRIAANIEQLMKDRGLGDVHCYKIFGHYDLLVRAWLHPNIVHSFPTWLKDNLRNCVLLRTFDVSVIDYAWYDKPKAMHDDGNELLKGLTEENIRAIQEGAGDLREPLTQSNLLLASSKELTSAIKFFVAVDLDRAQEGHEEEIAQEIISYLSSERHLFNEAVYHGHGECDILVKAQGRNFFSISKLPNWIGENFRGARTETYFSHDPHCMLGSGKIGRSTFDEIRGRDLFAQSIVPELYSGSTMIAPGRKDEVERFLRAEARSLDLDSKFKVFMREYAVAYLQARKTDMLKTLFEFFTALEEYLRRTHREFAGRLLKGKAKGIYEKLGSDPEKRKYPALGNLFWICSEAAKESNAKEYWDVDNGWEDLVHLRNQTAHGDLDPDENWAETIRLIMQYLDRLSRLLRLISEVTGEAFDGRYI